MKSRTTQAGSGANNPGRQQRQPARRPVQAGNSIGQSATFRSSERPGVATGARASARGAVLILTAPVAPREQSLAAPAGWSGTIEALDAMRDGNLQALDDLELHWRNYWRVLPRVPEHVAAAMALDDSAALIAFDIERGAGPRCETVIQWILVHPCPRCWSRARYARLAICRECEGYGYIDDLDRVNGESDYEFWADLDGNVVDYCG